MTSDKGRVPRTFRRANQSGFVEVASPPPRHHGKPAPGIWTDPAKLPKPGGGVSAQVRLPVLAPNGTLVIGGGRLSTMTGVKVPQNPSRGGRTAARDEGRLAGYLPNHSCVMKRNNK